MIFKKLNEILCFNFVLIGCDWYLGLDYSVLTMFLRLLKIKTFETLITPTHNKPMKKPSISGN